MKKKIILCVSVVFLAMLFSACITINPAPATIPPALTLTEPTSPNHSPQLLPSSELSEPFFEVFGCTPEAHIGDTITIMARTNYSIIADEPEGLYGVEGELGSYGNSDTIISCLHTGAVAQADSEGVIEWRVRVPGNPMEDEYLRAESDLVPGTLTLKFYLVTNYSGGSCSVRVIPNVVEALFLRR